MKTLTHFSCCFDKVSVLIVAHTSKATHFAHEKFHRLIAHRKVCRVAINSSLKLKGSGGLRRALTFQLIFRQKKFLLSHVGFIIQSELRNPTQWGECEWDSLALCAYVSTVGCRSRKSQFGTFTKATQKVPLTFCLHWTWMLLLIQMLTALQKTTSVFHFNRFVGAAICILSAAFIRGLFRYATSFVVTWTAFGDYLTCTSLIDKDVMPLATGLLSITHDSLFHRLKRRLALSDSQVFRWAVCFSQQHFSLIHADESWTFWSVRSFLKAAQKEKISLSRMPNVKFHSSSPITSPCKNSILALS